MNNSGAWETPVFVISYTSHMTKMLMHFATDCAVIY